MTLISPLYFLHFDVDSDSCNMPRFLSPALCLVFFWMRSTDVADDLSSVSETWVCIDSLCVFADSLLIWTCRYSLSRLEVHSPVGCKMLSRPFCRYSVGGGLIPSIWCVAAFCNSTFKTIMDTYKTPNKKINNKKPNKNRDSLGTKKGAGDSGRGDRDFARHVKTCLRDNGDYHKLEQCPLRGHICCRCKKAMEGEFCGRCRTVDREEARAAKFVDLEPQGILALDMSKNCADAIQNILSTFAADLGTAIPAAFMKTYENVRGQISKDLTAGAKPETLVHTFSSLVLLIRSLSVFGSSGADWIGVTLVITQFLSTHGIFGSVASWILDRFGDLRGMFSCGDVKDDDNVDLQAQVGLPGVIATLLALVHVVVFKKTPNWNGLVTFVTSVTRLPLVVRGVEGIVSGCIEAGRLAHRWLAQAFLGVDPEELERDIDPYCRWCDDVDALYGCFSRQDFVWSLTDLRSFDDLHAEGLRLRKETLWLNSDRTLLCTFQTRMAMLTRLQDEINSQNIRQSTRVEPYMIEFFGESAVGKSLQIPLVVTEFMTQFHLEEFKRLNYDHNACSYTRKSGDPRWDGVGKQPCIIYDDFMQVKDSVSNPSSELFEVIELSNSAPFNPLMAQLEKKGKVRLEPELVVLTSNIMRPDIKSLEKPVAVYRRMDAIWEVLPHPDVRTGGLFDLPKVRARHAAGKCGCEGVSSDVCLCANVFQRWFVRQKCNNNTVDCEFIKAGAPVRREVMMTTFIDELRAHRNRHKNRLEFFRNYAKARAEACEDESVAAEIVDVRDEEEIVPPILVQSPLQGGLVQYQLTERHRSLTNDILSQGATAASVASGFWGVVDGERERFARSGMTAPFEDGVDLEGQVLQRDTSDVFVDASDSVGEIDSLEDHELRDLAGALFCVPVEPEKAPKSWARRKIEDMLRRAREFVMSHPFVMAFGVAASVIGMASAFGVFARSGVGDVEMDDYVAETDSSQQKMEVKRQGRVSYRAENDDSQRRMETRRQGRTTYRAENDESQKRMESRRQGRASYRAEGQTLGTVGTESGLRWSEVREMCESMGSGDVTLVGQGLSDPNLLPLMRKAYRQTYILETEGGCRLGSCVAVRGRVLLTFWHAHSILKSRPFGLRSVHSGVLYWSDPLKKFRVCGDGQDLMVFEGPRMLPQGSDIADLMISDFTACEKTNLNVRLFVPGVEMSTIVVGNARAQDTLIRYNVDKEEVNIRKHYMYQFDTERGYCGALLFRVDRTDCAKLVGMHVCGSASSSLGLASAVCKEAVIEAMEDFSMEGQCCLPLEEYEADMSVHAPQMRELGYIGKVARSLSDQACTKISQSPFYGWEGEPIKSPVQLCGLWNGEDVKEQARSKLLRAEFPLKNDLNLKVATQAIGHSVKKHSEIVPRLWTIEEAAFGADGVKYCDAVDMNTSSGMPWKLRSKKSGKKGFLNKGRNWIREDLRSAVMDRIAGAVANERRTTVWSDHYKDELRLPEKAHKPRLFSGAPLDYTLALRMYFGQFCAACMDGKIANGVGVGMNPHGEDWSLLAKVMTDTSEHIACADFEKYDGSLDPDLLWAVCDLINTWYGDDHADVRRVLFADIVNAVHQAGGLMYVMDHSNPSGNPLTALLNSLYQLIALVYTLLQMGFLLANILRSMRFIVYGDDNMMAVAGGEETLSMDAFRSALWDEVGLRITNADKSGPPAYGPLSSASFLGRGFRLESGWYYGPREWPNLSLVFNWQKSSEPWEAVAEAYSECCFYELSHYAEEDFEHFSKRVVDLYDHFGRVGAPLHPLAYYRNNLQAWAGSGRNAIHCWGL